MISKLHCQAQSITRHSGPRDDLEGRGEISEILQQFSKVPSVGQSLIKSRLETPSRDMPTCSCEFHMAVRSATELLRSFLLKVVGKPELKSLETSDPCEEAVRRAVVLVLSSDIKFLNARISPLSFSASLLILMNWVRF